MVKINYRYRSSASVILEELHSSITSEEKKKLKNLLENLEKDKLDKIEYELYNEIYRYVKATPEQRRQNPDWNRKDNPEYKLLLVYYSFVYMQHGYYLIEQINQIPDKNGYREILAAYAALTQKICSKQFEETFWNDSLTFKDFDIKQTRIRKKN